VEAPPVLIGPMNGNLNPCESSTSTTYTIAVAAEADNYQWTTTGGAVILSGQGTNSISINWNGTAGGDVCVVASNDCGQSQSICATVVTTTTPVLNAGTDFKICGLDASLAGNGTGTWSQISGTGTSSFIDNQNPATGVTVSAPGIYRFLFEINESGCVASDEVAGEFDPIPVIANVSEDCSQDHLNYTVAFSISSGTSPFTVNGAPVLGSNFVSNPINAGTTYSFLVTDVNGCESNSVGGVQDCSCFKNAGEMELTPIDACADEIIEAIYLGGANVENGDTLLYILHNGNIPDGILAWNNKPEFAFVPPMQTYTTYFISAVTGTIGLNGLPDLNDPCLSVSEGTPIQFADIPDIELGPDVSISLGETIDITATSTSSIAKYNWFSSDTCTLCPTITLKPFATTTVMVEVSNADGCVADDQLLLTVLSTKELEFPNVFSPNGDQINDVIYINDIKSIELVQEFEVFDRWGNNVFLEKDFTPGDPAEGWDGSFEGKPLNSGVYICKMTALMVNGTTQNFAWDVTLVR
jgi:gliding motility-associated-like protein